MNTPDRYRMYNSAKVTPYSPEKLERNSMDTINRDTPHSMSLRTNKQMVLNTNYTIDDSLTTLSSHRQSISKMPFKRIIGDVRD